MTLFSLMIFRRLDWGVSAASANGLAGVFEGRRTTCEHPVVRERVKTDVPGVDGLVGPRQRKSLGYVPRWRGPLN